MGDLTLSIRGVALYIRVFSREPTPSLIVETCFYIIPYLPIAIVVVDMGATINIRSINAHAGLGILFSPYVGYAGKHTGSRW